MAKVVITDKIIMKYLRDRYIKNNPIRTADTHDPYCCCKRCVMDKITGHLNNDKVLP